MALTRVAGLSLGLVSLVASGQVPEGTASASGETLPLSTGPTAGGDVAVWLAPGTSGEALIFGVDRLGTGFYAYRLDGGVAQHPNVGPTQAIDVVHGVSVGGAVVDVVQVVTTAGTMHFFTPSGTGTDGTLSVIGEQPITTGLSVSAAAMARNVDAGLFAYAGDFAGRFNTYRQRDAGQLLAFDVLEQRVYPGRIAALAADDRKAQVYAVVEGFGLYRIPVHPDSGYGIRMVDEPSGLLQGTNALAVYSTADAGALLITASATQNKFQVFSINYEALTEQGRFSLVPDGGAKGTQGCQGLEVATLPLGFGYGKGLLVAHDELNLAGPNYKLVRWEDVANSVSPPFAIDTRVDVRLPQTYRPDAGRADAGVDAGPVLPACVVPDGGIDGGLDAGAGDGGLTSADGGPCAVVMPMSPDAGGGDPHGGGGGMFPPEPTGCGCGHVPLASFLLGLAGLLGLRRRGRTA